MNKKSQKKRVAMNKVLMYQWRPDIWSCIVHFPFLLPEIDVVAVTSSDRAGNGSSWSTRGRTCSGQRRRVERDGGGRSASCCGQSWSSGQLKVIENWKLQCPLQMFYVLLQCHWTQLVMKWTGLTRHIWFCAARMEGILLRFATAGALNQYKYTLLQLHN